MNIRAPGVQFTRLGSSDKRNYNLPGQIITNRTIFQHVERMVQILGCISALYIAEGNLRTSPEPLIVDTHASFRIVEENKGRCLEIIK